MTAFATLTEAARAVLLTADARAKASLSRQVAGAWRIGAIAGIGAVAPPERPARPDRQLRST